LRTLGYTPRLAQAEATRFSPAEHDLAQVQPKKSFRLTAARPRETGTLACPFVVLDERTLQA
jgi:hypothetical protein